MANIYCDTVTKEMLEVAQMIANSQREDVKIITPTATVEVQYEKERAQEVKTWIS